MKKKVAVVVCLLFIFFIGVAAGAFVYRHPTHYSFVDSYVIGQPIQKIIDRYGEPYSITENTIIYMIRDDTPELIMGYDNSLWYVIEVEDGIPVRVYLREGYPGG